MRSHRSIDSRSRLGGLRLALGLLLLAACARAPEPEPTVSDLPVRVEKAARAPFQPTLPLLGVVRPAVTAEITVPSRGRLTYPGRFAGGFTSGAEVRASEVLATFSAPESELSLAEARLRLDSANSELARHQKAFDAGLIPASQLALYKTEAALATERLDAARKQAARLSLRAPVSGRLLVDHRIPPGTEVEPGTVLAHVAAAGALRIEGRAAAADLPQLRPGLKVRLLPAGTAQPLGEGVIREISPVVDAGGTVAWVAEVVDPTGLPSPGEGVEVQVELDARAQAVTVPEEALVLGEGGSAVFVTQRRQGKHVAQRRPVETGARGNGRIEVLNGLSPGDSVVVEGAALLNDGTPVTQIEEPPVQEAPEAKPAATTEPAS